MRIEVCVMAEWEKLIPRPRSSFLRVKCPKCGNEQVVFDNAVNKVKCNVCGAELAEPSGGKAKVKGEIVAVFE
jgi:small subunit ribosomal protein S27e